MTHSDARDLGTQPIAEILLAHNIGARDLVKASTEQITHKMVSRACKGKRLTPRVQSKIVRAINTVAGKTYSPTDLFTY